MTKTPSTTPISPDNQSSSTPSSVDSTLLFELALAIGGSFNTMVMLQSALDAFLRK
jgi:hypothetical protein